MYRAISRVLVPFGLGFASILCAQAPALGPEFQVNTYTSGPQTLPVVSVDAAGDFVVVWMSQQDGDGFGVFGQLYDSQGNIFGAEFQVNTYTTGNQYFPSVAMAPSGDFVVVWSSLGQDGSGTGIFGQRFSASGTRLGSEFPVNTYTTANQNFPSVAADASGNFVVAWMSDYQDGSSYGVFGQRFDSSGAPLGSEFQINTSTTNNQTWPNVARNSIGDFVVTWRSQQSGPSYNIYGQRYDASGEMVGTEFQINTHTGNQAFPLTAMNDSGNFVVAWEGPGAPGQGYDIFARRYDPTGTPLGSEFQVNSYTTANQYSPGVGIDSAGNILIAWASQVKDGDASGIFGRRFKADNDPVGAEFQINSYTTGGQFAPTLALNPLGDFVVSWISAGQDGSDIGVFARRGSTKAAIPMLVDVTANGNSSNLDGVIEPGETVVVQPGWTNTFTVPLTFTGAVSNFRGPVGPTYSIVDATANYGTVQPGADVRCNGTIPPSSDCYLLSVSGARPALHWDAEFDESLTTGLGKTWTLHIGSSFDDVPSTQQFYPYIENILHNGITGGCGASDYCPSNPVTRAQMAVFLLKGEHGGSYFPGTCSMTIFLDVPCPGGLNVAWINQLANEQITGGCGGGNYCPANSVTRAQMAVFLLKAEHGSTYQPPSCIGLFDDVACPSQFADWIEQLYTEGVTGGCSAAPPLYCPDDTSTRGQMAVFLVKTFGILLYGP